MSYLIEQFSAGVTKRFSIQGRFFLAMNAANGLNISFFRNRQRLNETVQGITTGFSFEVDPGFDEFEVYSASAQTVTMLVSEGRVGFADAVTVVGGEILAKPKAGIPSMASITVTPSIAYVGVEDANRKFFFLQNKSTVGKVWFSLWWGSPVTDWVLLNPGESIEWSGSFVPSGQLQIIGDIASNPDVFCLRGN